MQAAIFCVECGDMVGEVDGYEGQPMHTLVTVARTLKAYGFKGGTYRVVCLECINKIDAREKELWVAIQRRKRELEDRTRCYMSTDLYKTPCDHKPPCNDYFRTTE